ncbi:hypothetical protein M408DRAFT_328201 [Serendipita vermifera MAFF 305830]|uniref:Uncharacterized protein n=1 Tax=Serendipita vermifera MAFF 305830 TaxID=933852 RepID=A0A0C2WX42_SERVB|nr:hypothetical protein M408DRAFT_328201 [Serendipita vermifera MAFF 305830]
MSRPRNGREVAPDAPVVNPYDRFTQVEFDDYVGSLRNKIRDALDPRRGLRNRDRDSDASFGLGYGEFRFGRSVSVGETSFAASGQSVPRSSVEGDVGERRIQYNDPEDDPGSDTPDHQVDIQHSARPTIVVSGAGDEESPFVISDDDDDDANPAPTVPAPEVPTPRTKARQLLGLQEDEDEDEVDDDDGEEDEVDEDEEDDGGETDPMVSPIQAQPISRSLNPYNNIDDVQLIDDESGEDDAGDHHVNDTFDDYEEPFENSSPPWQVQADAEERTLDQSHVQDSIHNIDEYFGTNTGLGSQGLESGGYSYNASEPEMREVSGILPSSSFSSVPASTSNAEPAFSSEAFPPIFPGQLQDMRTWSTDSFSNGLGGVPDFGRGEGDSIRELSQTPTVHEHSRTISWPAISGFDGGHINIFDAVGYVPQAAPPSEPSFYFEAPEDPVSPPPQEEATATPVHETTVEVLDEQSPTEHEVAHPNAIEEPSEGPVPNISEDVGSAATPSFTPGLSPSGITFTAPDSSLLSDNSSIATSIPVIQDVPVDTGRPIHSPELVDNPQDLTLPAEVTQELNRDIRLLPDPHQIPEPTAFGIPEGVTGLATRIAEPSVWAEPPTPFRSENADDAASRQNVDGSSDESDKLEPTSQAEQVVESPPEPPRSLSRVRWRDYQSGDGLSLETPQEELETLEHGLLQPTPSEDPDETQREDLSQSMHPWTISTPVQTNLETPREELDSLAQRLVYTPMEPPVETPQEDLRRLEQSLFTGTSADESTSQSQSVHGTLTRDSTMTGISWSQVPTGHPLIRHDTSATLTGESYFPSQPISTHGRETPEIGTQETLDDTSMRHREGSLDVERVKARSSSPFSSGSPLSEDSAELSVPKRKKKPKHTSHQGHASSSVKAVGKRELRALQDTSGLAESPRQKRTVSKSTIHSSQGHSPAKGRQTSSSPSKKAPPKIVTTGRLRSLRSSSQPSSAISKQMSPTSTVGVSESSRDEIDFLGQVDEETQEHREDSTKGSEHGDRHPKNKRKRVARISMPGDDEDYLPDDVERSIKKRKKDAKQHDLDESLDTIDLASALGVAETTSPDAHQAAAAKPKKAKGKKKQKQVLAEDHLESKSLSGESSDRGSDFVPSPDIEKATKKLRRELDTETVQSLSPATQAKFKPLNPDSRAYRPTESESSDSEEEDVTRADLIADVKGVVENWEELAAAQGEKETDGAPSTAPKSATKSKAKSAKKIKGRPKSSKHASLTVAGDVAAAAAAGSAPDMETKEERSPDDVRSRSMEMEVDKVGDGAGFVPAIVVEPAHSTSTQPLPPHDQSGASESIWKNPLGWLRSKSPNVVSSSGRTASPASDKMDTD